MIACLIDSNSKLHYTTRQSDEAEAILIHNTRFLAKKSPNISAIVTCNKYFVVYCLNEQFNRFVKLVLK